MRRTSETGLFMGLACSAVIFRKKIGEFLAKIKIKICKIKLDVSLVGRFGLKPFALRENCKVVISKESEEEIAAKIKRLQETTIFSMNLSDKTSKIKQ